MRCAEKKTGGGHSDHPRCLPAFRAGIETKTQVIWGFEGLALAECQKPVGSRVLLLMMSTSLFRRRLVHITSKAGFVDLLFSVRAGAQRTFEFIKFFRRFLF